MELLGFFVALALAYGAWRLMHAGRPRRSAVPIGLDPADIVELDAMAQRLLWERLTQRSASFAERLRIILGRRIPPRAVSPASEQGQWLLLFADGGTLRVTARRPGEVTDLMMHLLRDGVTLLGHSFDGDDVVLVFAAGPHRVRLVALAEA